ncbi:Uncharacterised protein [uncultured archaeon]|nr:Uncharacterised protein [uncultured archaeon]
MYVLIKYVYHPIDSSKTSEKGYSEDKANFCADEVVELSKKTLSTNDLMSNDIILDVKTQSVVKNRYGKINDFNKLYQYYHNIYGESIDSMLLTENDAEEKAEK